MQETRVRSLGWEDSLEKEMASCPSIVAWEIPWMEELGGLRSMGSKKCQTQLSNGAHTQPQLRCLDTTCLTNKRNNVSREKVNWKTDCRKISLEKKVSGRDVIAVTRAPVLQIQHVVWVSSIENSQSLGVI